MLLAAMGQASGSAGVQISDQNILTSVSQGQHALAGYSLLSNGLAYRVKSTTGAQAIASQWTNPTNAGVGADYECRAQLDSGVPGSINGSPLDTWLPLSVNQGWDIQVGPGVGEDFARLFVSIRRVDNQTVVSTASIWLNAIVFDGPVPP